MAIDPADVQICLGHDEDLAAQGGALMPPLVQTSLFAQPSFADLVRGLSDEYRHHVYSRGRNPTVEVLERKLAGLERGEACLAFGSGMGAVSGVLFGLLEAGDHVVFVNHVYGPTLQLAAQLERFGVRHDVVYDLTPAAIDAAIEPQTRVVWFESPGTMLFRVVDIAALVEVALARGVRTVIDNSWATPLFQKPLALGVDIVVHTCTKYIGGHSDLVAGAVVATDELLEQIFYRAYLLNGAALGPFDAWLAIRGLRTLPTRLSQHQDDALAVARFLEAHPGVRRVFHPVLTDPSLAERQMTGYAGVLSFELDTEEYADVAAVIDALAFFRTGVSWGGTESVVTAPNHGHNGELLDEREIPRGLIRLSVGLEGADILVADLERALDLR